MDTGLDKRELFSIGTVARSLNVSENMIRRIEAAGLLQPVMVSESSGYRYYNVDNVLLLHEIIALKSFGFVYEDLREYLREPGNYSVLYEKLRLKREALDQLMVQFEKRFDAPTLGEARVEDFAGAWCFCRDVFCVPKEKTTAELTKNCIYEAIRRSLQVDYTRSIAVEMRDMDYRRFRPDQPQRMTICIPLSKAQSEEGVRFLPGGKCVIAMWDPEDEDGSKLISTIDALTAQNHLRQRGALRIIFNFASPNEARAKSALTFVRALLPVC